MISDRDIEREQARAEEALERRDQKMEERCGNCRFWRGISLHEIYPADDIEEDGVIGDCRRYPPVLNTSVPLEVSSHNEFEWIHPIRCKTEWCGEWQPSREPEKQD